MNTTPTPEAVEAAIKYATYQAFRAIELKEIEAYALSRDEPTMATAARILAAEVERLRAELAQAKRDTENATCKTGNP